MSQDSSTPIAGEKPSATKPWWVQFYHFLAGLQLATFLLLSIFALTWFATLEQTLNGLQPMMEKYFSWNEWDKVFIFPEIGKPQLLAGKTGGPLEPMTIYFPMLGGFWLCALFTLNLTLGGLIRFKKSPKKIGILLTHFSIVFLMISAAVTHITEERGVLQLYEGEKSNVVQDYVEQVIEVSELENGEVTKVHVVDWKYLEDLFDEKQPQRDFKMEALPFDLRLTQIAENGQILPARFAPPGADRQVENDYWLRELESEKESEANLAAAGVEIISKSGERAAHEFVSSRSFAPATFSYEGENYLIRMRKKLRQLPFTVQLDDFRVERDPGTMRAAAFESDVTRTEGATAEEVLIEMNEPMRREGWTFFQANWGPQDEADPERLYSVLEVVRNPADQWPLYALLVSMAGLFLHFGMSLYRFIAKPRKKSLA